MALQASVTSTLLGVNLEPIIPSTLALTTRPIHATFETVAFC